MPERVILVALARDSKERYQKIASLEEMSALTKTAGGEVIGRFLQIKEKPSPKTLLGRGKIEELKKLCAAHKIDLLIFDDQLTPSQMRNIEEITNVRVIDRRALILDIFALHARNASSITQVELAQLQYRLSMLTGKGVELSRLGGGIGTRGPGEKQLEVDKRRIKERITHLKRFLKRIAKTREIQRASRQNFLHIALAGYTNSGKSTLFKTLTKESVYISDELFATLDSNTKAFELLPKIKVLLTDTVGFIKNLPPQLIASFKATLDEIRDADLIIHLIDASEDGIEEKINVVEETLKTIGCENKEIIKVFNKIDLLYEKNQLLRLKNNYPDAVFISALKGTNISLLKKALVKKIKNFLVKKNLAIPKSQGFLLKKLYQLANVLKFSETEKDYKLTIQTYRHFLPSILREIKK